jgi:hypothetical protein
MPVPLRKRRPRYLTIVPKGSPVFEFFAAALHVPSYRVGATMHTVQCGTCTTLARV